ncbi:MAG TPA: DUF481 domain-containing protein [Gemmatales bacterium]|nr:DUF481 domain-containing protein [Gemmatales bacterium]
MKWGGSLVFLLMGAILCFGQNNLPPTMFSNPKPFVEMPPEPAPPPAPAPGDVPSTFLPPIAVVNPWTGAMEFGINGANGNSDNFNLRYGIGLRRRTEDQIFTFDTQYNLASLNDIRTQNRLFSIARDEWYFRNSPWGLFVDATFEYDEFRAFDIRVASHAGTTYKFLDNQQTLLKGRAGAGASREFGGPNNDWIPELLFGLDFEHRFSDTTKLFSTVDYLPNLNDFSDYRIQFQAGFVTMLSKEYNIALKLGVQDLYDSTPEGRLANDLFYFVALMWKF